MKASTITRIAVVFACFAIGVNLGAIVVPDSWVPALLCGSIGAIVGYRLPLEDASN